MTTVVSGLAVVPLTPFVVFTTVVVRGPGPVVIPVINFYHDVRFHSLLLP